MCEPRFLDHQLYVNGCRVIEGRENDYIVVDDHLPAFNFVIKGDDRIIWTEPHGAGINEFELEPKKVHRLCPKCLENSKPQYEATGLYHDGFGCDLCVPCAIELIAAEIEDEKERLNQRLAELARYREMKEEVNRHLMDDTKLLTFVLELLDAPAKLSELVQSTTDLAQRTRDNLEALKAAHESLVEDGDC
ncbi:MAG: hypothetical protein GWN58_32895 [Anaerolineae bacterium]|nr:hypothetical protein [Thermoplasmata archaeon]NIV34073.1 hypothetical protein [Anaerolineae bacterium]NIY05924.1 hypothetical protein [Thermoplasmata archaeon]